MILAECRQVLIAASKRHKHTTYKTSSHLTGSYELLKRPSKYAISSRSLKQQNIRLQLDCAQRHAKASMSSKLRPMS